MKKKNRLYPNLMGRHGYYDDLIENFVKMHKTPNIEQIKLFLNDEVNPRLVGIGERCVKIKPLRTILQSTGITRNHTPSRKMCETNLVSVSQNILKTCMCVTKIYLIVVSIYSYLRCVYVSD